MNIKHGWSLDVGMWGRLAREIEINEGIEWHAIKMWGDSKVQAPGESGVYMLCSLPPLPEEWFSNMGAEQHKMFNAFYIGSSRNLKTRFQNYVNRTNLPSLVMTEFFQNYRSHYMEKSALWFVHASCKDYLEMEGALIDCFGSSVNQRRVITRRAVVQEPEFL